MANASCLCGAVQWELDGPFEMMAHCHCSRCRKAHGSIYATYATAPASGFRIRGTENIVRWHAAPGMEPRSFCRTCGSVLPGSAGTSVFAPAGNFTEDPGVRPQCHFFATSKAPWFEIEDGLQQFEGYPPEIEQPVLKKLEPLDPPGQTRGSCLCGTVAFVVTGEPKFARHCHCARCQRARSAAHATNLVVPVDGVRFTRGEDHLTTYKLPEARYFAQVFCDLCGSPMPRSDASRDLTVVPMGSLDDDPGIRPSSHIFVTSKAPWHTITDTLPQNAEY
jgi:hypothetical protein